MALPNWEKRYNEMQRNIITVGLESDLAFTSTKDYQNFEIPLKKELFRVGELLQISEGKIVIPAGVSKILVNAHCLSNGDLNTFGLILKKNNSEMYQTFEGTTTGSFAYVGITDAGLDVVEGDVISLMYYMNNAGYTRKLLSNNGYRTYMTIKIVN